VKIVSLMILAAGVCVQAQTNTVITDQKTAYDRLKANVVKAAEKMPEDAYSFKPTPEMQSFGERIAHIAGQMGPCSGVTGERKPNPAQGKTSKADIVAALKASYDACDAAWGAMNDKTAMETIAGRGGTQVSKLSVLIQNNMHIQEMYGYISPYMRLKGVVPPSSDRN
jgi:DinB family protein